MLWCPMPKKVAAVVTEYRRWSHADVILRNLLDGYTAGDEEDAAFDLLTANPSHTDAVIAAIGWDRLEDEIGDRFSKRFPETAHR